MPNFIFENNINTSLQGAITSTSTTITLANSNGLPAQIPAGFVLVISLRDLATQQLTEILYAPSQTITGATLTVLRAQEGTAAQAWNAGDFAYSTVTAGQMQSLSPGRFLGSPTVYDTAGTFTFAPNPAANSTRVRISGGGGAGGGAVATNSSQASGGSGGGCGTYAEIWISGAISGTVTAVVGAGGAGVAGAAGNPGSASSFGSYVSCPGGVAGVSSAAVSSFPSSTTVPGPAPAATISGALQIVNVPGGAPDPTLFLGANLPTGGRPSSSPINGRGSTANGDGGNGVANLPSSPALAGLGGYPGIIVVEEFA